MSKPEKNFPKDRRPIVRSRTQAWIEISIDVSGNLSLETIGTHGQECDQLAGKLEASLGAIESRTNKDTYAQD